MQFAGKLVSLETLIRWERCHENIRFTAAIAHRSARVWQCRRSRGAEKARAYRRQTVASAADARVQCGRAAFGEVTRRCSQREDRGRSERLAQGRKGLR